MSTRAAALAAQPDPDIAAAAAAAAVQANAAAAAADAVAAVPGFALSPARATAGVIDMTDKAGSNLFNKGADSLPIRLANGHRGFDGKIPVNGVKNRSLLEAYGQISMANVQTHVLTYVDQPTRDAQHSFMMH
eukprot:scaffold181389_cov64-Attheya_sp.AAC.2